MRRATTRTPTRKRSADMDPAPPLSPERPPPEPQVDVQQCFAHLLIALDALAQTAGSPPEVMHALDALRALLGKE